MNSNSDVEEIIKTLKMNIIICGRKIDKNIIKLIIAKESIEYLSIDINNNEEFTLTTFDKPKWYFYEFKDGFNDKKKDEIYEIIHKNFGIKEKYIESSLIFFTEEDEDDKILLDYFDEKNSNFHPFIIFVTNNNKKEYFYYENYIKENELDFDERNIFVINTSEMEPTIIQQKIFQRLWKNCCYYNGIGDNIVIPELELVGAKKELNVKYNNCLNFFITGKPGSGKSRLVNIICNEKKAKERIGGSSFSNRVIKYFVGDFPIALYDTPGFNSRKEIELTIKKIENKMNQITDDREQIHGIFYVINQNSSRTLDEGEIVLIKFILKYEIPLFFLLNYSKHKDIQKGNIYLESLLEVLEKDFSKSDITKYIYLINLKNDYEGNIIFGLNKLFNDLYNYYLPHKINIDELNNSFEDDLNKGDLNKEDLNNILKCIKHSIFFRNITQLKDALKICHYKAENIIKMFSASSFVAGIIPIPFSDVYSISSIEIILFSSILTIYGYKLNKFEIKNALKSLGTSSISAFVGFGVGNILLLIPGIGTLLGSLIRGSVASITTFGIGKLCINYCEQNFEETNAIEFYKNLSFNYNRAIDDLKIISENMKESII